MRVPSFGKFFKVNRNSPEAFGVCDRTGFIFNRNDLIKEMVWRGNALVWSGFLVGRPFVDIPNEQSRPPILAPDPVPVLLPKLPQNKTITWSQGLGETWENLNVLTWGNWGSTYNAFPENPQDEVLQSLQNFKWGVQ